MTQSAVSIFNRLTYLLLISGRMEDLGKRKRRAQDIDMTTCKKRVRRHCVCGYQGCSWSGTDQNIYKHTKLKHEGLMPFKVFPESQFAPGGRFASWITPKGKLLPAAASRAAPQFSVFSRVFKLLPAASVFSQARSGVCEPCGLLFVSSLIV